MQPFFRRNPASFVPSSGVEADEAAAARRSTAFVAGDVCSREAAPR
jgi:hypothetical protein